MTIIIENNDFWKREEELITTSDSTTSTTASSTATSSTSAASSSSVNDILDSNGCVICSTTPSCPVCDKNEQCAMTTQTCSKCPETYCLADTDGTNTTSTSTLSSAEVGGIAGALSGFFFILMLVGAYFLFKKYRHHLTVDYEQGIGEEMKELTGFTDYDDDDDRYGDDNNGNGNGNPANRRSPYSGGLHNADKRMSTTSLSTVTNSVLTKASNVLNIVYIPGVTSSRPARPPVPGSRRNTRRPTNSVYSRGISVYSKETYFSDLENASIHGGNVAMRAANPTLVDINKDDYNFDEEDEEEFPININLRLPALPGRRLSDGDIVEEEDESEEEDSENENRYKSVPADRRSKRISVSSGMLKSKEKAINEEDADSEDNSDNNIIDDDEEEEEDDAIQLNIGISAPTSAADASHNDSTNAVTTTNHRAVPNRYAALIQKKDQTNRAKLDPFSSHYDPEEGDLSADDNIEPVQSYNNTTNSESYSESSSDSDEENIEMLLQQNAQSVYNSSHNGSNNNSRTHTHVTHTTNSNSNTQQNHSNTSVNPFASPLD